VSSQTVSRVSNGHSNVDEQTRAWVVQARQTLGYRPNGAARALKSGRFHTVGVIMTSLRCCRSPIRRLAVCRAPTSG
jgi:DNA-binding LacI/PurR family transcriptional regulator